MFYHRHHKKNYLKNHIGVHLFVPSVWEESVLQPNDYIAFLSELYDGLERRPMTGIGIFGAISDGNIIGASEITKHIDTIKQLEGSFCVDRFGYNFQKNIKTLLSFDTIFRCGFYIDDDDEHLKRLAYELDRYILSGKDINDLTAYMIWDLEGQQNQRTICQFLEKYNIKTLIIAVTNFDCVRHYDFILKNRNLIFDRIRNFQKLTLQHGVDYVACEDHYNLFRNRHAETDIIFYTLRGGIKVALSPNGQVMITGGKQPYDAGFWQPNKKNALDMVLETFKQHDDISGRQLLADQGVQQSGLTNINIRSSILATAIMAGNREKTGFQS